MRRGNPCVPGEGKTRLSMSIKYISPLVGVEIAKP